MISSLDELEIKVVWNNIIASICGICPLTIVIITIYIMYFLVTLVDCFDEICTLIMT